MTLHQDQMKTIGTCGLVLRCTLEDFGALKRHIMEELPDVAIVCQKTYAGTLWIKNGVVR